MIRFLQISDIHFKDKNGNDDEYRQMKCRFLEDIAKCQDTKGEINYILICGDIAFSGLDNEYKIAKSFIDTICDMVSEKIWEEWDKCKKMRKTIVKLLKHAGFDKNALVNFTIDKELNKQLILMW